MKKSLFLTALAGIALLAFTTSTFAAEGEKEGGKKEMHIKGEAKCAKCSLKEDGVTECQTVIEVEGKKGKQKFYVENNDVAKAFHKNVCKEDKKVTATGTVKREGSKRIFTATKIEVAKE